jgi:transposase-like protein
MKRIFKTEVEKEVIIAEYLLGGITFRSLEKKHGIDFRVIHSWVTTFKGKTVHNQKKTKKSKINTRGASFGRKEITGGTAQS